MRARVVNVRCELTAAVPRAKLGPCFALHGFIPRKNQKDADEGGLDERGSKLDGGGNEVELSRNQGSIGKSCTSTVQARSQRCLSGVASRFLSSPDHWAGSVQYCSRANSARARVSVCMRLAHSAAGARDRPQSSSTPVILMLTSL